MRSPTSKVHPPRPPDRTVARARAADAGTARGPGLAVAAVVAAIVFAIGHSLFPVRPRQEPTPPVAGADAGVPTAMGTAGAPAATPPPPVAEAGTAAAKS